MVDQLNIEIAGVNIRIRCPHNGLSMDSDPAYESFLKPKINPGKPDIEIDLKAMTMPYPKFKSNIFDSGKSWSMSKQNNNYYINYTTPVSDHPVWLAKTNKYFTRVTVFCNTNFGHYPESRGMIANPVRYPLDQIILMYYFALHGGILIHASGIEINQEGYIFAGRSGAGKTTVAMQFLARHYAGLLSDDRVIVREAAHSFRVFGTPWPGKGGIARNVSIPLAGIFFLQHSRHNTIEQVDTRTALEGILPVASIPWYDSQIMAKILSSCEKLITHIPAYKLSFKPDTGVVDLIERFIS